MTVAKAITRGLLIAGWLGSTALGGPMLVLGTFSTPPAPVDPAPGAAQAFVAPSGYSTSLRLGSGGGPSSPTTSTGYQPPAPPAPTPPAPAYSPPPAPAFSPPPAPAFIPPPAAYSPPPVPAFTVSPAAPVAAPSPIHYDAYVNLGAGPYPNAGSLTTDNALPWYASPSVSALFGGTPTPQQQADFDNAVIQRVGQTYRLSGINLSLTDAPGNAVAHTISVVANAADLVTGQSIGMTYLGGNGFHFIDQSARSAQSVEQLEWIVAHNIAHELMLAFNVPENHDTSGQFIDARDASWRMMVDPQARFSAGATGDLLTRDFRSPGRATVLNFAQVLESRPVPEPATLALWIAGAAALGLAGRAGSGKSSPTGA